MKVEWQIKIKNRHRISAKIWFLIQQNCIKTGETRVKDEPYLKKRCNTIVHSKKKKEKNKNDLIPLQSAPES